MSGVPSCQRRPLLFSTCGAALLALLTATGTEAAAVKRDPCASKVELSSIQAVRCAQSVVAKTCARKDGAIVAKLSNVLGLSESRLRRGLRVLNRRNATEKNWCDLSAAEVERVVSAARQSKREVSQSREEWLRFTIGDENGFVPPDGLSRALRQRRAMTLELRADEQMVAASAIAGLPSSPTGWTNVTGYIHPVGRINDLLIHPTSPNTMWAGSDGGGIWKTTDGGTTWQAVDDFFGSLSISAFAMRAADPSTIYVATGAQGSHTGLGGDGIFKSTDGGSSWSQLAATDPSTDSAFQYVYDLAIDPADSNTVIAATYGGAYITTNGGTSWTEIAAATTTARNVAIHPSNRNLRVIAADDGTVKVATDGTTYTSHVIATVTGASYTRLALAPSDQNVMYALVNNSGTTQLYRSATGGTSWGVVATPADFFYNNYYLSYTGGLWVDPTNANHIVVVEGWAMVTSDASAVAPTWTEPRWGWVDFHGAVSDPGYNGTTNKKVYLFDDGGLYRWTDIDTVYTTAPAYLAPTGMLVTQAYTVAGRGGNLIFGAQDVASRYHRTTASDPTAKWRFASGLGGHDGAATAADRTNPNILYGSTQFLGIHRSTDGGATTGFICQGITDITCGGYSGTSMFIAPFILDPNDQSRMLAGAASLWRANDVSSGTPPAWAAIHSGVLNTNGTKSRVTAIAVAPTDSDVIWVSYQNGAVYTTANGTATSPSWTQVTNVPTGSKLRIYIDRTNASRVFIGLSGFSANRLVKTEDGGATWASVPGLPSASVFAIQQHPSNASWLYVGTMVGLFASSDGGATWTATNQGPANVQVRDLQWYADAPAVLLVGTFGRGIWRATVNAVTLAAPTGLTADGTTTTSVALAWNTVSGATTYKIFRSSTYPTFTQIGSTSGTSHTDSTVTSGNAYLYTVRASDGSTDSSDSSAELATTIAFTDPTLTPQATAIRAVHWSQMRTAVNAVRTLAGLPSYSFTDPTLSSSVTISAVHLSELRAALDAARSQIGIASLTYTDAELTARSTTAKGAHLNELRLGVK
ncbi:MAG: hypothetical protein WA208_04305 [Thermoanaerobaculia bacterium]